MFPIRSLIVLSVTVAAAIAAPPVAKITSPGSFSLAGRTVKPSGVPNWPLVSGDKIVLGDRPGRIEFRDGSVIFVVPRSTLEITSVKGRTEVRLQQGAAAYRFSANSSVDLAGGSLKPIPASSKEGRMMVNAADALWNPVEAEFYFSRASDSPEQNRAEADEIGMDPDNYNLDQIDGYREYEPDWGSPPGEGGSGLIPPPAATVPGQPDPASAYIP
jgi:hypothetical protein